MKPETLNMSIVIAAGVIVAYVAVKTVRGAQQTVANAAETVKQGAVTAYDGGIESAQQVDTLTPAGALGKVGDFAAWEWEKLKQLVGTSENTGGATGSW